MHRHIGASYLHRIIIVSVNRQLCKASGIAQVVSLPYVRCTRPLCTSPLAVVHSLYTPARCFTFTAHARSLSYIHCTRPLAVVHSLYTPLAVVYIHCTCPLAVVHSLHTPARCRTRSLAVVHSLYTPARCRTRPLAVVLARSLS